MSRKHLGPWPSPLDKVREAGLTGSETWDPGNISGEQSTEVTVTGAALGDFAEASFSLDVEDLILDAQVTAANTVTCILVNKTGGNINLDEGTLYVKVDPRT
ncbi:unnamed protein product [marine sediment metagenome]|uniref:IPT/TIG domain-containing protein n=1 Tax=marine sediment metagenome TaxID=412755 RepID=X1BHF9_9ZZZZ